jgi:polar amino acid transport system substrate-binding protein
VPPLHSEHLLQMLLLRRVDGILANHLVMTRLLERHPRGHEVRSTLALDKPLGVYLTHRFLARQATDFMDRFNAALRRCTPQEAAGKPEP